MHDSLRSPACSCCALLCTGRHTSPLIAFLAGLHTDLPLKMTAAQLRVQRLSAPSALRIAIFVNAGSALSLGTGVRLHCEPQGGRSPSAQQPTAASSTTMISSSSAAASADTAPRCTRSNACVAGSRHPVICGALPKCSQWLSIPASQHPRGHLNAVAVDGVSRATAHKCKWYLQSWLR